MTSPAHAHVHAGARPIDVDLRPLRGAAIFMFAAAFVKPLFPSWVGLPPCPLRTVTGIPCPFCGMTRGVIALVHGHLGTSLMFNPGAVVIVAVAVLLIVAWRLQRVSVPVWLVFTFFTVLWTFQLFKYATGRPL